MFRKQWRRWTGIVEQFARRRPGRRQLDYRSYRALHDQLIERCGDLAARADEANRPYYENLRTMVQPWMSPRALARADREILYDLLLRCKQVQRELGGWSWMWTPPRWLGQALLLSLGILGFLGLLVLVGVELSQGLAQLQRWSDRLWFAIRRAGDLQRLFVATVVVIFFAIYLVSRTARS